MDYSHDFMLRHILTKNGNDFRLYKYGEAYEAIAVNRCNQEWVVDKALSELEQNGELNLDKLTNPMLSDEMATLVRILRSNTLKRLRECLDELEVLDTLQAVQNYKTADIDFTTLDEIVNYILSNDMLKYQADWTAVLMLADDLGKHITYKQLRAAIANNAKSLRLGVPIRQTLQASYVDHKNSQRFPNWPRTNEKQIRYYKIAKSIYRMMQNMVI